MFDTITDPVMCSNFVGRKFHPTHNFKIMEFFFFTQRYDIPNYVHFIEQILLEFLTVKTS